MEKGDTVVHYVVGKNKGANVNASLLVSTIYKFVQNREIYFKYEPNFFNGTLIFGVVGFPHGHEELQSFLGDDIKKLNCTLHIATAQ